jgi:hypothetical protein
MTKTVETKSEKVRDDHSPDQMFGLPAGYFTAEDMARAFNIPFGDDGPIPAVKEWVQRHQEYDLVETLPGKWIAPH